MKSVAVYSLKGGVGKTTLAVNLAWASASLSARRTLLWDLDPQAAATFLLRGERLGSRQARGVFERDVSPAKLISPTDIANLALLPADKSLRGLDRYLHDLGKKKRLGKLLDEVAKKFDRIILDCPPGLTETIEQVLRAADVIVVPVIPSPLSQRAADATPARSTPSDSARERTQNSSPPIRYAVARPTSACRNAAPSRSRSASPAR